MQSRLPDINTAFNTYRTKVLNALNMRAFTAALGGLKAINGLLPPEYRITVDDEIYNEKIRTNIFARCDSCKKEFDYNKLKILKLLNSSLDAALFGAKYREVWICECKHENRQPFKLIQTSLKEPYFLQVVPLPPTRGGVKDRRTYPERFENWAWGFLRELEERMAQYRDDNWERGGDSGTGSGPEVEKDYEAEILN